MSHYKPYPAYKDSGVEWLGKVPKEWTIVSLSRLLATPVTDGPHETPEFLSEGIPFLSVDGIQEGELVFDGKRFISEQDHFRFSKKAKPRRDDILLGKAASVGKIARVKTDSEFNIWSPLALIRVNKSQASPTFVEYSLKSTWLQAQTETKANLNTQFNLGMKDISKLLFCVPPADEQLAITSHLDRETTRIDALITKKTRFIELLREKRQALITHAVTKGLDPNVKMKDSGEKWLGEIPQHWEVVTTRRIFKERDVRSETGQEELMTVSHLTGVTPRSEKNVNMFEAETTEGYKRCLAGDLVINTLWAWMGAMGISRQTGIVSPAYNIYVPAANLEPEYVDQIVRLPLFSKEVTRFSKGIWSSRLRLYPEGFFQVKFPVPPLEEQQAIAVAMKTEVCRIDLLAEKAERSIQLLKERRSALITAAVTGQIDLREAT